MSPQQLFVLILHLLFCSSGAFADFDFLPFDLFHDRDDEGQKEINLHSKREHVGQEMEDFHFGPQHDGHRGQELVDFPFWPGQEELKGQEAEEIHFGPKNQDHRGQEAEAFHFGPKHEDHKGQEVEDIHFGPKHEEHKGQEVEEINFGPKHEDYKGQEVEEINFGPKHEEHKGQEPEEFHFGRKPEHPKGQEVEEINFGPKHEDYKGQEVEEINFGPKHEEHKGQEVEEFHFGQKPEHPKGQEVEEINFGPKHEEHKGQEVEEFHFGQKPEHPKGQEVEEINFGPKHEEHKGQEVEEINFGPKHEEHKGQEPEEFHFVPKHEEHKGQEVEEINFGPKHEDHRGQEVEEINFGNKHDHPKGQKVEEINFGPKHEENKGQEPEEYHFVPLPESNNNGQEIEPINFGSKPGPQEGDKPEEVHFVPWHHDHKGQEVEEINFESKTVHPMGHEGENLTFGSAENYIVEKEEHFVSKSPKNLEGNWFDIFLPAVEEKGCEERPKLAANSILKCESNSKCEMVCQEGYSFASGMLKVTFECEGSTWVSSEDVIPECNPFCEPPCQNEGTCVAPNQCSCHEGFEGAQCQFQHKPCKNHPPVSHNSYVNCNHSDCIVNCFDDYSFPDGTSTAHLTCHYGEWVLTGTKWKTLPECRPSCHPPCINGGTCLDYNKCQCPREYVGPQCQYELSACDAKKLNFNGYYTCRGENDKVSCTLSCPEGHDPEEPLAMEYICHYSSGTFFPELIPKCVYGENTEVIKSASSSHTVQGGGFGGFETDQVLIHPVPPSTATCSSWKKTHFKNFDGKVFSFDSVCSYTLVEDSGNNFRIVTENYNCDSDCSRSVKIFYQDQEYKVRYNDEIPILTVNDEVVPLPNQSPGFSVEKSSDGITVTLQAIDVTLNWNAEDHLSITINGNMWNKTSGLCGNFNNDPSDDFFTPDGSPAWNLEIFLQSWLDDAYNCQSLPVTKNHCADETVVNYCNRIFTDIHFQKCHESKLFQEACIWDGCKCGTSCACDTISEFVNSCKNYLENEGIPDTTSDWRQIADCPVKCPPGKVYSTCGPSFQTTCGSLGADGALSKYSDCVEGCFCPEGLVQHNNSCIQREYCPCKWRNMHYNKGERIMKDCNTCTCQDGEWVCSTLKCSSRCSAVGTSHYLTFDGRRYDLMGRCAYYLLKTDSYAIASENQPCAGDLLGEIFHGYSSKHTFCTKTITILHGTDEIKLKMNKEVLVNGIELSSFPVNVNGITIRLASLHVIVKLPDDVEIWWDGNTNVYIDLPGNYGKHTGGLCGSFNDNQKDDFKTPEGDVEQTAVSFAEKWKVEETCDEMVDQVMPHPCDSDINHRTVAEKHCQKLLGSAFKECHSYVDVEPYYKMCLRDVCSCQKGIKNCVCPIFADYATACSQHYMELPWRSEMRECGLHCPHGQIYQPCGDSCARSCQDISITNGHCDKKCSEGCSCPEGLVLNSANQCIHVSKCPCFHQNIKYRPGQEIIMESEKGPQFCACLNALWSCRPATKLEIDRDYKNSDQKCNETLHEEYTTCTPAEPKTCKNMHEKPKHSSRICFPGCVCKKGFVWDSIGKVCVNASECPCHHGGKSYAEGEKFQQDCNTCTCSSGRWSCTQRECSSVCSTWGDSHFKTFDGKIYDFQGSCDYVLASGVISDYETFFISLQIVPCGSTGISCPKSVTLKVGSPEKEEKVIFRKSDQSTIPKDLKRILIREVGVFIFAEVFDLGISVKWDRGTRVYVKADSRWKHHVKGLCGNFNDNELDDFKTPSSGETSEISPVLFADSWRLQLYCPESNQITDTCERRPHRKAWSRRKCSILNSEVFEACHSEVDVEPYLERCVLDACGCDEGGDCECMCTAIAAYAEECTLRGIPIKWRAQELCPLQCPEHSTYDACVSACPPKSCDNQFQHSALLQTCAEQTCVEGCDRPHCPPGHVLAESTSSRCIPIASCKTVCLTVNNVTYLEGDLMESDDCHSCYCSHHVQVCIGEPCHEVTTTSLSPLPTPTSVCSENEVWDECIVKCNHVCNHLVHNLNNELGCLHDDDCISGCRPADLKCPPDMFLRDKHTCVHKKDCPCRSMSGLYLKPGEVVNETECERCQCINNEYECMHVCSELPPDISPTSKPPYNYTHKRYTVTPTWEFAQEGNVTVVYHTTVGPPPSCPEELYASLIDTFSRFSASSNLDASSLPALGSISSEGTWIAGANNADQYLQVDLGRIETIFGVTVAAASTSHVTDYHLLYSLSGEEFHNVLGADGKKETFKGPSDVHHSVKQVLENPIEARFIRFQPVSWHEQIAMKVDVLGCKSVSTVTTPGPRICSKPIGIGQKHFPKLHITASSSKPNHEPKFIDFGNEKGWRPLTNSKSEWIQLDFGEIVNLTGVVTRGVSQSNELSSPSVESWVERYKVEYSHDGTSWGPILDDFGNEMIFEGNTDGESEKKNFFTHLIQAKSLKIVPLKWHENIALRLDVLGCYEPENFEVEVVPPVTKPTIKCNVCPGTLIGKDHCKCKEEEWWNGENCVNHSECPCFVGLIAYPVGTTFTTEKCEECICKLHGIPHCTPKQCKPCPNGLQSVVTPLCGCICKPCEEHTRLCPTSNECLDETKWCDGIQDCPDDELNCTTKAPPTPCLATCPPGYEVVYRNKKSGPTEADDMLRTYKVKSTKSLKSVKTYRKQKKSKKSQKLTECPPYDCVPVKEVTPTECPVPECPLEYLVISKKYSESGDSCPLYACEPVPEYANCTVLSKNIKTFDGTEYKYEICDHVMARHDSGLWNVTMFKNCTYTTSCATVVQINHGAHTLELNSHDRIVKFDSFTYTNDQMELLNSKIEDFTLNTIGNSIVFTSDLYGFEVVFDTNGNLKVKVPSSMKGHLGGLCGFYNGRPADDKTRPDGKLAKTAVEFGDSWLNPGGRKCIETVCPMEMQKTALEICLKLKEKPFNACSEDVNMELCIESTCECLSGHKDEEKCRCQLLSDFASSCKSPELFGWRVEHDCPSSCPPNLVHYDCYPYACQPTCGNEECTEPATNCYSGCFCPDGLVKRGDQCIKVTECRDCVCSGLGDSTYLTFDGGLTFNGNCTYVATRGKTPGGPDFEVLITNTLCNGSDFMTCTDKTEIKIPGHSIKIVALPGTEEMVKLLIDGHPTDPIEAENACKGWAEVVFSTETSSVKVGLPKEHVDVRYFYKKFAFTISLPSHYYSDKVEGLCGTCSQRIIESEEMDDPEVWQTEEGGSCLIEPPAPCIPTPEHEKLCLVLNDTKIFGQCLAFVDPSPFIDQCLTLVCANGHVCSTLEAYGQACRDMGICVDWRSDDFCPFTCASDLEYQACNNGCGNTCDQNESCEGSLVEGCFCPEKEVLINGTCKSPKFCEYCDEVGRHYEDEVWHVDKCTNCSCKNHSIICDKTECPLVDIDCDGDEIVVKEENHFECCPKYKCGCKPREDCPKIELPKELLPGQEAFINETGCCPKVEIICQRENCPLPKTCRPHYIEKVINTTDCCPEYFCEKPDDLCIYEYGNKSAVHKRRTERGIQTEVVKEIGERWSDGPCKTCICVERNGVAEAVCTLTECPSLKEHHDYNEYELEEVPTPEKCCPEVIRKSCRHNGHLYNVGDTWVPDETNPCETLKCNIWGNGSVIKETRLEMCNDDCEHGWEYKRTEGSCCGHCVQVGCPVGDKVYKEGEYWFSEDRCAKSTCTAKHGHFLISTEMKTCPSVDDCPHEDLYRDGCCLKCKIRAEDKKNCAPEILPPESTVKIIREKKGRHGECINIEPIANFTRCLGNCESFTVYRPETHTHESVCKCCKPQEYALISVDLKCKDGLELTKSITVPSKCSCMPCGG